jgi:glyoxylase-like metal-dependent hydrolase (beta-lactamase superfamily II)
MHGKTSPVFHEGKGVFAGLNQPLTVTRYHSLIVKRETLPECLELTAWTQLEDGSDGEIIRFGGHALRAIHTPGHTPGSTCFSLEGDHPMLFSGDTLFRRSIGRTDLWGGDTEAILASIRRRLFTLPGDTPVVCGHGPDTTIDEEKRLNPFAGL